MTPLALPLHVVHDRPFVELQYEGPEATVSAWTWLDTGGGAVILGHPLVQALGLECDGQPIMEEDDHFTPVRPPVLCTNGRTLPFGDAPALMVDRPWVGPAAFHAQAFLPARFFRQFAVTFDYPGRRFILDSPDTPHDLPAALEAPVHPATGFVRVELEIAGERLGFLLDTGASYSMISKAVWQRWHEAYPHWPTTHGAYGYAQMTGHAHEQASSMIRVPEATLGDVRLERPGFVTRPEGVFENYMSSRMTAPIVGALAGNILRHLCFTIDYQHQRLHVQPGQVNCGQDLAVLGLCLRTQGPQCFVTAVSELAHATTQTQVQVDDEVRAVNGQQLDGRDLTAAMDALCGRPGELLHVQLRRNRTLLNLRLPVVTLLS